MKKLMIVAGTLLLAGCSTQVSRMADCEAKGVSRDACYVAEQNRASGMTAAAEKQALENAQAQYTQHAQASKKTQALTKHYDGMTIKRDAVGVVTVDGKLAAEDEVTPKATVYAQGLHKFIIYKSGNVAVMRDGIFQGYAK
jgi:uncharacterized protein YceK